MNLIHRIRRLAGVLAGALLASAAAAPAALASPHPLPDDGSPYLPTSPPNVVGGMPGWQIALIAVGAALLAATVAVILDRRRTAHRKALTTAA